MQFDEWCKAQAQAFVIGLGKGGAEKLVEKESGFEVGTGKRVLDGANALTEV